MLDILPLGHGLGVRDRTSILFKLFPSGVFQLYTTKRNSK